MAYFDLGCMVRYTMDRYNVLIGQISNAMGTGVKELRRYLWVAQNFSFERGAFEIHYDTYLPPHVRREGQFARDFNTVTKHLFFGERAVQAGVVEEHRVSEYKKPSSLYRTTMSSIADMARLRVEHPDAQEREYLTNKLRYLRRYMTALVEPADVYEDPYFIPYSLCAGCGAEPGQDGHSVRRTRDGMEYPMCQECLETEIEPDMARIARMYYVKSKEATHQLDEFRDAIRTYD